VTWTGAPPAAAGIVPVTVQAFAAVFSYVRVSGMLAPWASKTLMLLTIRVGAAAVDTGASAGRLPPTRIWDVCVGASVCPTGSCTGASGPVGLMTPFCAAQPSTVPPDGVTRVPLASKLKLPARV
jgi:hypothetical protein